MNAHLSSTT